MSQLHEQIFLLIYHALGPASFVSGLTVFVAQWLPWIIGIMPFVYELFLRDEGRFWGTLNRIYLPAGLVYGVTVVIKFLYETPRPFAALDIPPSFMVSSDPFGIASFPSSHTAFFAALAVTMYFCNHRLGKWMVGAAFAIGLARIGAGVHWPVDIIGGFIIGVIVGYLIEKSMLFFWKDHAPAC